MRTTRFGWSSTLLVAALLGAWLCPAAVVAAPAAADPAPAREAPGADPGQPTPAPPTAAPASKAREVAPRVAPGPAASPRPAERPSGAVPSGDVLGEASNQFSYGRYERVVTLLRPLVERGLPTGREDRVEALRLYGVCLYLTGRRAAAAQTFRELLELAPETRLDPRLVQPEVVTAFETIRLAKVRTLQKRARSRLERRWAILNLVPSAGQFQNGHWQKGVAVLSLELAFLGLNIGSYYALRSPGLRQPDRTYVERDAEGNVVKDHRPLARALMAVNYCSLALLLGTVVYGMVDGFIYYYQQRGRLERLLSEPVALAPVVTRGGGGLSLSLGF